MNYTLFRLLLVVLLIGVNGFFAAAEISLISVRQSRLRELVEDGSAGAQAALNLLAQPGRLLSVTQVGVTLASLALGWAGEGTLYQILSGLLGRFTATVGAPALNAISFLVAFLVISYFHVVMGEVVPKNLAIAKADRLAIIVAPALLVFYRFSIPFVIAIERTANAITRTLRLKHVPHGGGHSAEELKLIVTASRGMGVLPESQEDIIHRVLDLSEISVREVMVPRNDIVSISSSANLDQVLQTMIDRRHSRLPVYEGAPERIIGVVHYKDLLPVWEERRRAIRSGRPSLAFRITRLMRRHLVVPETKPLSQMLDEFRQARSHIAMVVDEFGTIIGMLTIKDVLEQVVGRIEGEHEERPEPRFQETNEVELDGATRIRDLESEFGLQIPADMGFETLAGFLLYRLGEIPHTGAAVEYQGRRYTVLAMDRNRIARVKIEKLPPQPVKS